MKFAIRIDPIWRPFMLFIGATASNSYVEFEGSEIHLRFGRGFSQRIARENVIGASPRSWSIINGLGVRAGGQIFGLIGSTSGVVEMQLRDSVALRFVGFPWAVRRIAISLEDPQGFMDAINGSNGLMHRDPSPIPDNVPMPGSSAIRPASPPPAEDIPRTMDQLTPRWLTAALRERGIIRDAAVTGVRCEGIGVGVGFLGQLARLHLAYDRAEVGAPATIIAKMPTLDPGGREVCRIFQFYEHEIRFYDEISAGVRIGVPRCYYTAMNIEADDYLILLEDLAGLRMGDEVAGCSAEEAERVIRSIAEFQATWWQSPELEDLAWMPYINGPVFQSAEGSYNQAWEPFLQMFGDKLSPAMRQIASDMRTHVIDLLNALESAPQTIVHGDYRLDNIFFGDAGGARPITVIDWQISARGRGIFDVAYFLASCIEPSIRRAEEQRLVRLWHEIATGGRGAYSFDDAWRDYRLAVLFCNVYTVIAIGTLDAANERGMALFNAWLTRRCTAIEELNAGELMPR